MAQAELRNVQGTRMGEAMSELTQCNYCKLRDMKRRAKASEDGERVVTLPGKARGGLPAGVEVFTVPPGVSKHDLKKSEDLRKLYGGTWFMALTDHCCC